MAKIRVHELAKELNLTNKAILTKLKAMNIEVKSHMSSLEDETVEHIKLNIFGNKQKDQDSKTGTSVIRRRKKHKNEISSSHPEIRRTEQPSSDRDDNYEDMLADNKPIVEVEPLTVDLSKDSNEYKEGQKQNSSIDNKAIQEDNVNKKDKELNPNKLSDDKIQQDKDNYDEKMLSEAEKSAHNEGNSGSLSQETVSHDADSLAAEDKSQKSEGITETSKYSEEYRVSKEEITRNESSKDKENSEETVSISKNDVAADQDDDRQNSNEETSDSEQDNDASSGNDKKKKRKKKQKKSEPAKIIKLAEPPPPLVPVSPAPKKREYVEKISSVKNLSSDREKTSHNRERTVYEKDKSMADRERAPYNRGERTGSETTFQHKGKTAFDKDKAGNSDRERTPFDRDKIATKDRILSDKDTLSTNRERTPSTNRERTPSDREKSVYSPSGRSGVKSESAFSKTRNKKDVISDIPFIPIEPSDKDDAKSKRKKLKVKKKKWGEDEDLSSEEKVGQKKRKSVVEGKDLYEQGFLAKKSRKKDSKNRQRPKPQQKTQITVPKAIKRRIKIDETIELSELAKRMSIKANEMIQKLMGMGIMVTVNQTIDFDTAALVAAEFDYEVEKAAVAEDMLSHANEADDPDNLIPRSPVVTIMGHVDHGKTSLLDVIRKSKITTGEAGGITQHIGAYSVETPNGGVVTFLDTPGHAAFTSMRSRGAKITDIVVLVVAADDGVMPQTVEAINHSKAAGVPVVVAVNKIDKPDADPERVMRELSDHGLLSEEWGGDVIFAKVSAKKRQGIDELLDLILLQAEVLELKANPNRLAKGHVVEARLDAGRGPVATVLVQQGTLKTGQPVVCGLHSGKIRLMTDDMGKNMDTAGPSTPVEIVGLSGVPEAGDEFIALASEKDAKNISESRMQKERAKELAKKSRANLEKLFANMGSDQAKQLKLIIKADVHGSLEALNDSLIKLSQEEVDIKIVHSGTGAINESDVSLAAVSDAIIIGFNVRPTPKVREMAKDENVDMRFYDIIYNVINDIKTALTGLMPSTFHEIIIGRAEVRDIFVIPGKGTIAGCFVQDGKVARGEKIRLLRDGVIKCDSSLSSLRRFKDDAKEVTQGYECGIGIERFNDLKVGDIIECYEVEERKASIESLKESTTSPAENE
ncbi:MAG: translation initiation factor IF-2 [Desulfamplus sp.]|nr:translation initiation factor IF-2 [Desulfamplus sp.]